MARSGGFLGLIERAGNKLPEPALLFLCGTIFIMALSHVGHLAGWSVKPVRLEEVMREVKDATGTPVLDAATGKPRLEPETNPETGRPVTRLVVSSEPIKPVSLLTSDGLYWAISNIVKNFITFPPLGIVLVGMLGVGVAEKTGLFDALLKAVARAVPRSLLTPTVVFLGVMSNVASDAGYIVLPPLAAALFLAAGRSPLVGIAAAFAGVSGGFSANLLIGGTDALIAGITQSNAAILDPAYVVTPTSNWYFMAASTFLLTALGWLVCSWLIEPRYASRPAAEGGAVGLVAVTGTSEGSLTADEHRGLKHAGIAIGALFAVLFALTLVPGWPLHGQGANPDSGRPGDRWVNSVVPIVFFMFLIPGFFYGRAVGKIRSQKDFITAMVDSMKAMGPVIVMAFFAAQFIKHFEFSNLGRMLAIVGGTALAEANAHPMLIVVLFIILVMGLNLLISSMSAKFLLIAPIFVPMFMMLGISPELTQCAYRLADSVTNTVTPMNAYLVIILAVMQRYAKDTGLGTLISLMVPFSIAFGIAWVLFLLGWMWLELPLGKPGPLWYVPAG